MAPAANSLSERAIGSQGLKSSPQGLGAMGMSMAYINNADPVSEEQSIATIHRALELGVSHIDSSDFYGWGANEELLKKALGTNRKDYLIASKFAMVKTKDGMSVRGDKQHVREACEASLKRLGTSYIDLYYQHRVDRNVPIEETWTAMKELVKEGKVKYLGISEASAEEVRRAHAVHPITACQLEWSLWTRSAEKDLIPTCRELGIGIVAYSPLGRGFLTGTIKSLKDLHETDTRVSRMPRFQGDNLEKNIVLVEAVTALADKRGCTPGQLALAWVHAQGDDVFPIPGTKRVKYLEENVAAFHIKLSKQELAQLEAVFAEDKIHGGRYDPNMMKHTFEGTPS
ncbi:hypothetical protein WJX74_003504 [Apatococcus lobatus]|uniref:NADP-dependent oxidoreductase domain-containing protein n=2 Tax=Apatococcus TaxID=904362 RepID=A0AAW1STT2_9CHLO